MQIVVKVRAPIKWDFRSHYNLAADILNFPHKKEPRKIPRPLFCR